MKVCGGKDKLSLLLKTVQNSTQSCSTKEVWRADLFLKAWSHINMFSSTWHDFNSTKCCQYYTGCKQSKFQVSCSKYVIWWSSLPWSHFEVWAGKSSTYIFIQ